MSGSNSKNQVLSLKQGDVFVFKEIYEQWRSKGYYYFFRKTNSEEDSKDLLQNTFLRLWQYRHSLNDDYNLDQQLFFIARTVFIDYIRKSNKRAETSEVIQKEMETAFLHNQQSMAFDMKGRLQKILGTMPALRKKVFELHRLEGYSYKEIASNLSISEKAVDNHLTKATKLLRKAFTLFTLFLALFN